MKTSIARTAGHSDVTMTRSERTKPLGNRGSTMNEAAARNWMTLLGSIEPPVKNAGSVRLGSSESMPLTIVVMSPRMVLVIMFWRSPIGRGL